MHLPRFKDDSGSAPLEFIGFGLLLQLPMIPLTMQLVAVQLEQLSAESIARNALRAYSISDVPIESSIELIAADFNLPDSTKISHALITEGNLVFLQVTVGQAIGAAVSVAP